MGSVTYFVALPFSRSEEGELVVGEAQERYSSGAALIAARQMAYGAVGAVAFSPTGDPGTGEFDDAVVIALFGEVPSLDDLLNAD